MDLGMWFVIAGVMMFVFGMLGLWTASQKRRSTTEGFVLGAFFGPLGVVLEGLLPSGEKGDEPENVYEPNTEPRENSTGFPQAP